ncbi:MAG: hypothetical protein JSV72_14530, partial [Ralstonia sp.]
MKVSPRHHPPGDSRSGCVVFLFPGGFHVCRHHFPPRRTGPVHARHRVVRLGPGRGHAHLQRGCHGHRR